MRNKKEKYIAQSDDLDFEEKVKKLLLGRKIVKAEKVDEQVAVLTLDTGVELIAQGNDGCGGCGNGWYYLEELNTCDNAITNVECLVEREEDDGDIYHIFVYADNKKINCLQYSGYDNGYYGTGYDLRVRVAEKEYIERGALLDILQEHSSFIEEVQVSPFGGSEAERTECKKKGARLSAYICQKLVETIPAADVVEVVRCKDCKNWRHEAYGRIDYYECSVFCGCFGRGYITDADDFCSYGERKTE